MAQHKPKQRLPRLQCELWFVLCYRPLPAQNINEHHKVESNTNKDVHSYNYHDDYYRDELDQQSVNEDDCVYNCISNHVYDMKINHQRNMSDNPYLCNIVVNSVEIKVEIDTGADVH